MAPSTPLSGHDLSGLNKLFRTWAFFFPHCWGHGRSQVSLEPSKGGRVPSWAPIQLLQSGMGVPGRPGLGQEPLITTLAPARAEGEFGLGDPGHPPVGFIMGESPPLGSAWGRAVRSVACPSSGFPRPPSPVASHSRGGGRGRQPWEASDCSRCFQLTFQNGLLLAAGRADGRGGEACGTLGRRAHA